MTLSEDQVDMLKVVYAFWVAIGGTLLVVFTGYALGDPDKMCGKCEACFT